MKQKGLLYTTLALISLIVLSSGIIWADNNGVWIDAADVRGGTFGSDEQGSTTNYEFINPVDFNSDVEMDTANVKTIKSNSANGNVVIQLG